MALILYGISRLGRALPENAQGLYGQPARWFPVAGLQVLVSECAAQSVLPGQANLADFQALIQRVSAESDILPMSFGMVASDESVMLAEVEPLLGRLHERLSSIANRVEFSVRLIWTGENLYAHFTEQSDELRLLCEQYAGRGRKATESERLHLGQTLQRLMYGQRSRAHRQVVDALRAAIIDYQALDIEDDRCWAKLALLVQRDQIPLLHRLAAGYSEACGAELKLQFSAPYPPYGFLRLSLD